MKYFYLLPLLLVVFLPSVGGAWTVVGLNLALIVTSRWLFLHFTYKNVETREELFAEIIRLRNQNDRYSQVIEGLEEDNAELLKEIGESVYAS